MKKNGAKKNLMSPIELDCVNFEDEKNMSILDCQYDNVVYKEMNGIIDINMPVSLRSDYLRMKSGLKLPKLRKDKVQEFVKQVLIDNGYWEEEDGR
jgi:hypothetical protein